jgi:hypothetical protein
MREFFILLNEFPGTSCLLALFILLVLNKLIAIVVVHRMRYRYERAEDRSTDNGGTEAEDGNQGH